MSRSTRAAGWEGRLLPRAALRKVSYSARSQAVRVIIIWSGMFRWGIVDMGGREGGCCGGCWAAAGRAVAMTAAAIRQGDKRDIAASSRWRSRCHKPVIVKRTPARECSTPLESRVRNPICDG